MTDQETSSPLAATVFERLRREILSGQLTPGTILVENAQAERFGVSKGPVREAMKRLVGLGFLRSMPRVGYMVTSIKVSDLDEIFDVRLAVEPAAVLRATERATPAGLLLLDELASAEPAIRAAPESRRGSELVAANRDFHVEIARISGNERFVRIVATCVDELERVVQLLALNLDDEPDEHPSLVRAMRSGDARAAAELTRTQLLANHRSMRAAATAVGNDRAAHGLDLS